MSNVSIYTEYIQVNLPTTKKEFEAGNGEGVWVLVKQETKQAYDDNAETGEYEGILANDSFFYDLSCGDKVYFEMRGEHRPVAKWEFLKGITTKKF